MRARYRWQVEARDPTTRMWSVVFKGSQPEMNRFLAERRLDGGLNDFVEIRKRRVLKRVYYSRRED